MRINPILTALALITSVLFLPVIAGAAQDHRDKTPQQIVDTANEILQNTQPNGSLSAQALAARSLARDELGEFQQALDDARAAVRQDPASPLAWIARAKAAALLGGYDQALRDLNKAAGLNQGFFDKHGGPLLRAVCLIVLRQTNRQTIEDLEKALTESPRDARVWLLLGKAKLDQGDGPGAFLALDKAIELDPDLAEAYFWRARAWVERHDGTTATIERAKSDINRFLALKPANGPGLALRGCILAAMGGYRALILDTEKALDLMGGSADEHRWLYNLEYTIWNMNMEEKPLISLNIAETAGLLNRPALAPINEALYSTAFLFNPKNDFVLTRLGISRMIQDRVLVALEDLKKARAMGQRTALNGLALAQSIRLAHPPGRDALPVLNEVLEDQPDNADAMIMRARINQDLGMPQAAANDLEEALRIQPASATAALLLARLQQNLGRPEKALDVLDGSAAIHGHRGDIQMARGRVLLERGRYQDALEALDIALACLPDSAEALLLRAKALASLDQTGLAQKDLARAIAIEPSYIEALDELDRIKAMGKQ